MVTKAELRDGMKVRTSDGHDLGKIVRLDSGLLVIEKGFFFPKDYEVPISLVSAVRDDEAHLSISKEAIEREGGLAGASADAGAYRAGSTEEARVQLAEEELQATKRVRDAGEVRVRKDTSRTVEQRADADVRREEARIDRADEEGRGAVGESSEDEASRSGYGATGPDVRGGGLLGLGKDDER
jgi:hypothetical protein